MNDKTMSAGEIVAALRRACHDCNPTPCCEYETLGDAAADLIEAQRAELARLTAERDEALKDCSGYCATCAFVEDCAKHDNNDAAPPVWYYGDCDDWMWRGTQKEDNDG